MLLKNLLNKNGQNGEVELITFTNFNSFNIIGHSETEGSNIEPMFLLKEIPTGIPPILEIAPLSPEHMEKLAVSFGTIEKANAAVQKYMEIPQ